LEVWPIRLASTNRQSTIELRATFQSDQTSTSIMEGKTHLGSVSGCCFIYLFLYIQIKQVFKIRRKTKSGMEFVVETDR
jgi:hypothetical protein